MDLHIQEILKQKHRDKIFQKIKQKSKKLHKFLLEKNTPWMYQNNMPSKKYTNKTKSKINLEQSLVDWNFKNLIDFNWSGKVDSDVLDRLKAGLVKFSNMDELILDMLPNRDFISSKQSDELNIKYQTLPEHFENYVQAFPWRWMNIRSNFLNAWSDDKLIRNQPKKIDTRDLERFYLTYFKICAKTDKNLPIFQSRLKTLIFDQLLRHKFSYKTSTLDFKLEFWKFEKITRKNAKKLKTAKMASKKQTKPGKQHSRYYGTRIGYLYGKPGYRRQRCNWIRCDNFFDIGEELKIRSKNDVQKRNKDNFQIYDIIFYK